MMVSHYYEAKPSVESKPTQIAFRMKGIDFTFTTDRGVFSKNQLDFGSEFLLKTVITELSSLAGKELRILDLGCGYGPVGIVIKRAFPAVSVTMVDINERAVSLAIDNAQKNLVKFANIMVSDGFAAVDQKFDVILTNPPIRAGKKTVFAFYDGAFDHLDLAGILYVVIQKKQGAPSSMEKLQELFGNCVVVDKDAGYWILKAVKSNSE